MAPFVIQLVINGIILGASYALVAVGLSLIFGVLEIVNFAHGELYMLGGFSAYVLVTYLGANYWLALIGSMIIVSLIGLLLYETILASIKEHDFQKGILLTIGVAMILQNGAVYLFTATPRVVATEYALRPVWLFGFPISMARLWPAVLTAVAFLLLHLFLSHTRHGKALRALAQNNQAALVVGMNPRRIGRLALVVGGGLCGLAGAALAPLYSVHPLMGLPVLFKAFAIIIIGGLGNIPGAALAAILIGVVESLAGGLGSTVLQDAFAFILMILILIFYPMGLFGRGVRV